MEARRASHAGARMKRTWREIACEVMYERDPKRMHVLVRELNDALEAEFPMLMAEVEQAARPPEGTSKTEAPETDVAKFN